MEELMKNILYVALIFTLGACSSVGAFAQTPNQLVEESIGKLTPLFNEAQNFYKEDPERLHSSIADVLGTFFDFDAFARGVMGIHFAASSDTQRKSFSVLLKQNLAQTFANGLMGLGEYSLEIDPAKQTKPKKASVRMNITTGENANHELSYSLAQNQEGFWRVRNVVFDGVNLGLTFRNQFASQVTAETGDIENVINNWNAVVEE
jgi:phospholipid transport system substrate-binding protein